jgi:hypothetical protein
MRLLILALTITTVCAIASTAGAETIRLKNRYSQAQVKAACDKVGGHFNSGSKTYGCFNQCTPDVGCAVDCSKSTHQCVGTTPRRLTGEVIGALGGVLRSSRR